MNINKSIQVERLVFHRSQCESPRLAGKEVKFLQGRFEKDGGHSVRSFRVERRLLGCPGIPEQTLPHVFLPRFKNGPDQDKCECFPLRSEVHKVWCGEHQNRGALWQTRSSTSDE